MTHRYVFVGGLHRSGTSLVTRLIAQHSLVSSISGAPVPENEGCYLQGAIPHTALNGRPMHFATDPAQHYVEGSAYDTLAVRERIEKDWAPWFDVSKPWRVEKSPVNLTRTRLYQQLFPTSQFVIVIRHPEAVAAAVAKWVDTPPPLLWQHWVDAHDRVASDLAYLHSAMIVRYEDLVADPWRTQVALHSFLGLSPEPQDKSVRDGNLDYPYAHRMPDEISRWGYGPGLTARPVDPFVAHPLRSIRDAVIHCLPPQSPA